MWFRSTGLDLGGAADQEFEVSGIIFISINGGSSEHQCEIYLHSLNMISTEWDFLDITPSFPISCSK